MPWREILSLFRGLFHPCATVVIFRALLQVGAYEQLTAPKNAPDFRLTQRPGGNKIQLPKFLADCDSVETDSPIEHHPLVEQGGYKCSPFGVSISFLSLLFLGANSPLTIQRRMKPAPTQPRWWFSATPGPHRMPVSIGNNYGCSLAASVPYRRRWQKGTRFDDAARQLDNLSRLRYHRFEAESAGGVTNPMVNTILFRRQVHLGHPSLRSCLP